MAAGKGSRVGRSGQAGRVALVLLGLSGILAAGAEGLARPRPAHAEPWAPVNDIRLKNDITTLKEYGLIPSAVTTWPIAWATISRALAEVEGPLPPHVAAAVARVRAKMPHRRDFQQPKASAQVMGTNKARLVRDFNGGARGDFDSRVSFERHWARAYARLSVNFRDDPLDRHDVNFDGSYGALALGNWMLFAGRVEQWWGPGWDSALLLSNNARPMPVIGLGRLEAKPFESRWLRWIGPWNLRMFAGRKSKNRNDFAHPFEVGYRVDFQPARWMSWGLTYMVQFCGQGRPCSFKSVRKAVLPFPNQTNTRANKNRLQNDPGDAQAGWDVSFQGTLAGLGWTIYTEQAFEDQIEDTIALYGATLTGHTGLLGGAQWRFMGEMADTFGDRTSIVFRKSKGRPLIYQNSIFTDGSTYRGRILGASLDFNSLLVTGRLMLQFDAGPSWELMVRHADINRPEAGGSFRPHLISANRERINILETRLIWPTKRFGQMRLEAGLADDAPNTPGRSPTKGRVEVGWSYGF